MDDVFLAFAWQLGRATEVAKYIAAEGTGYPHSLVLHLEPEGAQRFLEVTAAPVGNTIVISFCIARSPRTGSRMAVTSR